jgi:hypothetical protein
VTPSWVSAFLDLAPDDFERGVAFWRDVTGWRVSPARGEAGEFATLVPPEGDDHLRVQRLGSGRSRIHLDLHVASPREAADHAVALGATEVADLGYVVLRSPGGLLFCLVSHTAATRAPAATWPGGHRSSVDQVCIDAPEQHHDAEVAFWQAVTGRALVPSPGNPEFSRLVRPDGEPLHVLLQRLGQPLGEVRAHLDLATTDRPAETARHAALGATVVARYAGWTVLADPVGSAYCITDREPL